MKKFLVTISVFVLLFSGIALSAQAVTETPVPSDVPPTVVNVVDWSEFGTILAIVAGVASLVVAFFAWRNANPAAPLADADAKLAELITARREDRVWMDKLEKSYANLVDSQKEAIESLSETLKYVASLTPIKADDALSDLIEDIQEIDPPEPDVPTFPAQNPSDK